MCFQWRAYGLLFYCFISINNANNNLQCKWNYCAHNIYMYWVYVYKYIEVLFRIQLKHIKYNKRNKMPSLPSIFFSLFFFGTGYEFRCVPTCIYMNYCPCVVFYDENGIHAEWCLWFYGWCWTHLVLYDSGKTHERSGFVFICIVQTFQNKITHKNESLIVAQMKFIALK